MFALLDTNIREVTADALGAYNAMETTKRRHFDYMNLLEAKQKKFNLSATQDESDLLASLLLDHNQAVAHFKKQSKSLQQAHPEAHHALFAYISVLNEAISEVVQHPSH